MIDNNNSFAPPRATVADVVSAHDGEFQPMTVWGWRGRLGRLRFLAYGMVSYFIYLIVAIAIGLVAGVSSSGGGDATAGAITTLIWILAIPYIVFMALVTIRRSHDMNWSGWTALLAFVPFVGLIWIFKAGSPGANDHGAPPPPNGAGVKWAAFGLFGVLFLGGILAAIAIPAYSDYVKRAQAAQIGK